MPLITECFESIPARQLGEVIVVDDCSTDASLGEVINLRDNFKKLRIIRHKKTAGQSAALRTGIIAARYPIVAQLDGDGQNDPADLPHMVDKLGRPGEDGPALIGGIRINRMDTGSKRWASKAANWIRNLLLQDNCPDTGCGTKVYWREAFLRLPFFSGIHRYLPALFQSLGYQCEYVPVNDRPRESGVSKYNNFSRALTGLYDLFGVLWLRKRTTLTDYEEL